MVRWLFVFHSILFRVSTSLGSHGIHRQYQWSFPRLCPSTHVSPISFSFPTAEPTPQRSFDSFCTTIDRLEPTDGRTIPYLLLHHTLIYMTEVIAGYDDCPSWAPALYVSGLVCWLVGGCFFLATSACRLLSERKPPACFGG